MPEMSKFVYEFYYTVVNRLVKEQQRLALIAPKKPAEEEKVEKIKVITTQEEVPIVDLPPDEISSEEETENIEPLPAAALTTTDPGNADEVITPAYEVMEATPSKLNEATPADEVITPDSDEDGDCGPSLEDMMS
eukprot:sb/3474726/